jgi:hypothetical protein
VQTLPMQYALILSPFNWNENGNREQNDATLLLYFIKNKKSLSSSLNTWGKLLK